MLDAALKSIGKLVALPFLRLGRLFLKTLPLFARGAFRLTLLFLAAGLLGLALLARFFRFHARFLGIARHVAEADQRMTHPGNFVRAVTIDIGVEIPLGEAIR